MQWLTVDLGNETGWALWDGERLVDSGYIKFDRHNIPTKKIKSKPKTFFMVDGLRFIREKIEENNVGVVVFEETFVGKGRQSAVSMAEKVGALMGLCHSKGVPVESFLPSVTNKHLKIKILKRENRKLRLLGVVIGAHGERHGQYQDQADAVALGMAYINKIKEEGKEL